MTSDKKTIEKLKSSKYRHAFLESWVKSTLALQIRGLRKKLNRDQKQFAEMIGTRQSAISRIEDPEYGKMSMDLLLKLAKTFDTALIIEFVNYEEFLARKSRFCDETLVIEIFNESISKPDV